MLTDDNTDDPKICQWSLYNNTMVDDPRGRLTTMFCNSVYQSGTFWVVTAHAMMIGFILFNAFLVYKFNKKKHLFPIRERAPRIAIIQSVVYLLLVVLLYLVEIITKTGLLDWKSPQYCSSNGQTTPVDLTSTPYIPWTRRIFKASYLTIRINIYLIFLIRYLENLTQNRSHLFQLEGL
jgi:hypothetical protein